MIDALRQDDDEGAIAKALSRDDEDFAAISEQQPRRQDVDEVAIAKSDDVEQQLHRQDNDEGATAVAQSRDHVVSASISEQQPCRRDDDKGATANAPSSDNEDDGNCKKKARCQGKHT